MGVLVEVALAVRTRERPHVTIILRHRRLRAYRVVTPHWHFVDLVPRGNHPSRLRRLLSPAATGGREILHRASRLLVLLLLPTLGHRAPPRLPRRLALVLARPGSPVVLRGILLVPLAPLGRVLLRPARRLSPVVLCGLALAARLGKVPAGRLPTNGTLALPRRGPVGRRAPTRGRPTVDQTSARRILVQKGRAFSRSRAGRTLAVRIARATSSTAR
mmetsp:Transcript_31556/g.69064  ORF Transcript_31556/g.69064 Transcript_31556/m.69064 type:complete len:217 (+) Transcript_31556:556-1206(+)